MPQVIILDRTGKEIGFKEKSEVDRLQDALYAVHVLVFNADNKLCLSTIPAHEWCPQIFKGKFGSTAATLVRKDENRDQAIQRCLQIEVNVTASPIFLGEKFDILSEGIARKHAAYMIKHGEKEINYNPEKIAALKYLDQKELEQMIATDKNKFAPTFLVLYERYKDVLWSRL